MSKIFQVFIAFLFLSQAICPVHCEEPVEISSDTIVPAGVSPTYQERVDSLEDMTHGFFRDGAYIVTAPFRPTKKGLLITAGVAAITGGLMGFDRKISNNIQHARNNGLRRTFSDLEKNGGLERLGRSSGVMRTCGLFYLGGIIAENERAKRVAYIGVESWFYNDSISRVLKSALGRRRPGGRDPYDFDGFGGNSSMPSGHSSTAFCLASVIASEYDSLAIDTAAYGTASMVAFSRLYRDVHWASDVVVSAFLGIAIGKGTTWMYKKNPRDWKVIWAGDQIYLSRRFGGDRNTHSS